MANSSRDSSNAHNPNPNADPISEVGSGPLITVVEQLAAIVRQLTQPREQRSSAEPEKLSLPRFNPEIAGAEPAAWCAMVSVIMEKRLLQDDELYLTISRTLEGTAA